LTHQNNPSQNNGLASHAPNNQTNSQLGAKGASIAITNALKPQNGRSGPTVIPNGGLITTQPAGSSNEAA